jgi:hypothetical protein
VYGTKYILGFNNDLNELYEIYFDVLDYAGDSAQLLGSEDVLKLRSTGGDEDKMTPILGTEALIDILVDVDTPLSIADLIAQHDNDIRVTVYREKNYTLPIFQGFIVVEDNSQPLMDAPFVLSVRALDGLGLLKGVDLVDTNGLRFVGPYSVLNWIAQILYKTGQTLPIRVYFNWYNAAFNTTQNPLEQAYLNSITFSQGDAFNAASTDPTVDINALTADDCYTALEKIVRCFRCRLFQEDGAWNLVHLGEYLNPAGFSYTEYAIGTDMSGAVTTTPTDTAQNVLLDIPIGKEEIIYPGQEDQIIYLKLGTKWVKLTYTYDQSQNKVCNQDFSEGDRNAAYDEVISSSIIDSTIQPVVNLSTQGYDVYCWEHLQATTGGSFPQPYPSIPATKRGFVRQVNDLLGFTKDRFLVIEVENDNIFSYFRSSSFLIDTGDILQISFSWRTRLDIHFGGAFTTATVILYGDDGTQWALRSVGDGSVPGNPTKWEQIISGTEAIGTGFITDTTAQWISCSANNNISTANPPAKAPISGRCEILLGGFVDSDGGNPLEYWYKDLTITILPYLNGSYQQLKGDYNYLSSNQTIKQTDKEDVEISDSPKRYFKGALVTGTGAVLLAPDWHRVGISEHLRFQQAMGMVIYSHLRRMMHKIEGTWKGLVYRNAAFEEHPAGYLGFYHFSDADEPTKKYMLTSFDKNIGTGQGRGVFVECLADQNDVGLISPDDYQFSYIFQ